MLPTMPELSINSGPGPAISMQVTASAFKAYDIRGIVGQALDEQFAEHLGRAFGSEAVALGDAGGEAVAIRLAKAVAGVEAEEAWVVFMEAILGKRPSRSGRWPSSPRAGARISTSRQPSRVTFVSRTAPA